ncbi:hypothetical protein SAMN05216226_11588 [Halovenus aranensis]|jgi:hypothetical protein|uniref:Uncharacterized protein n=1 Tax=Halovenus aranensis TaxID=890420 RepID=A0A1G8YQL4_9EURY|nr:hypothetical protein [Halovenus aranensis]SDK04714.1 hypothetical protein SAMN05216226_11588 [Halovenus aranensis]
MEYTTAVLSSAGEWPGVEGSLVLLGIILLAGIGTGLLFVASLVTCLRRRSRRYVLITVAVGALFVRSFLGIGTASGVVPMMYHHVIGHSLDFTIAAMVLYAAYLSGPRDITPDGDEDSVT